MKKPGEEPKDEKDEKESPPSGMLRGTFATLRLSTLIPPGHLGVGADIREVLKLPPFSRIKVVAAAKDALNGCKILVRRVVKSTGPTVVLKYGVANFKQASACVIKPAASTIAKKMPKRLP